MDCRPRECEDFPLWASRLKGKEAMASGRARGRLSQLWQMPLLVVSLGLFAYAAYLFIDPKPGVTLSHRIEIVELLLTNGRADAALEHGNKLLASGQLKAEDEARVHLLLAEALELAQKSRHLNLRSNHQRIIEQTKLALAGGNKGSGDAFRRLGDSYEALDLPREALEAYSRAIVIDPDHSPQLQRKVIDLQLAQEDSRPAEAAIERYLKGSKLSNSDRAWALIKKAQVLVKGDHYAEAKSIVEEALHLDPEKGAQGVGHYWLGYCAWKLGQPDDAERTLRVARDQLTVVNPLDAEAAFLLGKLRQEKKDPREAISFYRDVMLTHPASRPAPLARLNRGLCRIMLDEPEPALTDLHAVVAELETKKNRESYKPEAVAGLKQASAMLAAKENLQGALEVLEEEQTVMPDPPAEYFGRLARIFDRRAFQVEQTLAAATNADERHKREEQVRKLRTQAGDAYIALSRGLTLADDHGQGDAMWKGVDLYDRAGAMRQSIAAMERFTDERPDDGQTPDALLRLGRAYQASGLFDKAIKTFQKNQFRYPQSLAASKSGVPLAQALIAKGPEAYPKAEKVLLAVIENNQIITPEAEEFRQALFELAQLYYRTGRYEDAIGRLEETTQRYPKDPRTAQLVFLMGDSYRKSARLLEQKISASLATQPTTANGATSASPIITAAALAAAKAEAVAARRDRLVRAKSLFDRVVDLSRETAPTRDIDKLYLKLSHFYRADCLYDLGEYEEAIRLYDGATLRYQDDPSAVSAFVQIVNAYCALGRKDDARTANERAKWLLRRMPAESFEEGKSAMPRKYWDDWLRTTGESGMYAKDLRREPLSDAR